MVLTVLWTTSGCSSSVKNSPDTHVKHETKHSEALYAYAEAVHTGAHWWQQIQDPLLQTILQHALDTSITQKLADLTHRSSIDNYQLQLASNSFNVSPSATFGADHAAKTNADYSQYTLTSSLPIDLWGSNRYQLKAKAAAIYASESNLLQSKSVLVTSILQSYMKMRALQSITEIKSQKVSHLQRQLTILSERKEQGLISQLEPELQALSLEDTKSELQLTLALRDITSYTLANLSGYELREAHWLKENRPMPDLPKLNLLGEPIEIIRNRPDVVYFEYRYKEAQLNKESTLKSFYPQLTINHVINLLFVKSLSSTPWSLSAQFLQNNLNPLAISSSLNQANTRKQLAYYYWMEAIENAISDIHIKLRSYQGSSTETLGAQNAFDAADRQHKLVTALHAEGMEDELRVIQAKLILLARKEQLIEKKLQAYGDLISLYQSSGLY